MVERERQPAPDEPDRAPGWIPRMFEEKMARGGGPDYEAADAAMKRFEAAIAQEEPVGFTSDDEIEAYIDAAGLRKDRVEDWRLIPWTYWEARGAGPYRR